MSIFQLKGDILSYTYTGVTGVITTNFSTYLGFKFEISGQTSGDTNSLYISYTNGKNADVTNIIDLLDGIPSTVKVPEKSGVTTTARVTPSSRCAVTSPNGTVVFDVLYNQGEDDPVNDFASYIIQIISVTGSFTSEEAVYFTYNYYGTGGDLSPINGGYYQITTGETIGFGDITLTGTTNFSALTEVILYNLDLETTDLTSLLRFKPQTTNYGFLSIKKEGSFLSNSYIIESSIISSDKVKYDISAVTLTNETITHGDAVYVSFVFNGTDGTGFSGITNYGDNRILTSDGTPYGANAEANVTYDGSTFEIANSLLLAPSISTRAITLGSSDSNTAGGFLLDLNTEFLGLTESNHIGEIIQLSAVTTSYSLDRIYNLSGNSANNTKAWVLADAASENTATDLLGINLRDIASVFLTRGYIEIADNLFSGTTVPGAPLYLNVGGDPQYSFTRPSSTGQIVRIIGYHLEDRQNGYYLIFFNPSNDWIEI